VRISKWLINCAESARHDEYLQETFQSVNNTWRVIILIFDKHKMKRKKSLFQNQRVVIDLTGEDEVERSSLKLRRFSQRNENSQKILKRGSAFVTEFQSSESLTPTMASQIINIYGTQLLQGLGPDIIVLHQAMDQSIPHSDW
jgi:hypothetical protein